MERTGRLLSVWCVFNRVRIWGQTELRPRSPSSDTRGFDSAEELATEETQQREPHVEG